MILAASYLGLEGHGNVRTGLRPWPAELATALHRGDLDALHWSAFFASDCARFARMDLMCRLGFMAAELLDAGFDQWPAERRDRVGVCVETRAGCLATDLQFLQTPRPSLFAYTLPSTLVGEICIRYRLRGPVLCLMLPSPAGTMQLQGSAPAPGAGVGAAADPSFKRGNGFTNGGHTTLGNRPAGAPVGTREGACAPHFQSSDPSPGHALREATGWIESGDAESVLCLSVEAVNPAAAQVLFNPAWHACAVLLGPGPDAPELKLSAEGSVASLCRKLCIDKAAPGSHAERTNCAR